MNTSRCGTLLILGCVLVLMATQVPLALCADKQAANGTKEAKDEELPKSGILSRSVTSGYQSRNVNMPWGKDKSGTGEAAPITGSVSKVSARQWMVRVFNNSDEPYSADVKVIQYDVRGSKLKSDSFSFTLKPKAKVEREVAAQFNTADAQLSLERWRNLSPKKEGGDREKEEAAGRTSSNTAEKAEGRTQGKP